MILFGCDFLCRYVGCRLVGGFGVCWFSGFLRLWYSSWCSRFGCFIGGFGDLIAVCGFVCFRIWRV